MSVHSGAATIDEIKTAIKALTREDQDFIELQSVHLTRSLRRRNPDVAKDLRREVVLRLYSGQRHWYRASIAKFSHFFYSEMRSIVDQWREEARREGLHDRISDFGSEEAFESALRKSGASAPETPEEIALRGALYDELARREAAHPDRLRVIAALREHRLQFFSELPDVTGLPDAHCEAAVVAIRRRLVMMYKEGWFDRG